MKKILALALAAMMALSLTACTNNGGNDSSTPDDTTPVAQELDLKLGQVQYAAHGTKSFAVTTVVMNGDKIERAHIDEFQVLAKDSATPVPNNDTIFAELGDGTTGLASKRVNNDFYSKNMTDKGGATITYATNLDAIQAYAEGKTIAELEAAIAGKEAAEVVELVAGTTMVDTLGYLQSIIEAAKVAA